MPETFKVNGEEYEVTVRSEWTEYKWIGEKRASCITERTDYDTPKDYVVRCCRDLSFEEGESDYYKIWNSVEGIDNKKPLRSVLPNWVVRRLTDQIDVDIWLSQSDKISSDIDWYSAPDFVTPEEPQEEHVEKIRSDLKWSADRYGDSDRTYETPMSRLRTRYSWGNYLRGCLDYLIEADEIEKGERGYYYTGKQTV